MNRLKFPYIYSFKNEEDIKTLRSFMIHEDGYILSEIIEENGEYYLYSNAGQEVIEIACNILNIHLDID